MSVPLLDWALRKKESFSTPSVTCVEINSASFNASCNMPALILSSASNSIFGFGTDVFEMSIKGIEKCLSDAPLKLMPSVVLSSFSSSSRESVGLALPITWFR